MSVHSFNWVYNVVLAASRLLFLGYFLLELRKLRSQMGGDAKTRTKRLAALIAIFQDFRWKSKVDETDIVPILRFRRNVRFALLFFGVSQLLAYGAAQAAEHWWVFERVQ